MSYSAPRIQVFRPTMEEFKHFSKYIEYIESQGAHRAGLAKIIPPEGWIPRRNGYDDIDLVIPSPITQMVTGRQGLYQQLNISQKCLTVGEFRRMAESPKFRTPNHFDYEDLERKYWKNITYNSPIYGADVSGSLYDTGVNEFNIQRLNTILDLVKEDYEIQIEGVNTAYLYFGMWKTTFAWHTEDMDLYSINYVHYGAPKSWYVIPPEHGRRLERLAAGFFHGSHSECPAFLRHKMTIISPHILKQYSIPFSKITQEPGEFMITFPYAYHSGFNHGYNIAESTNFALPRWVEYGKRSISCVCRNDCVKICMDIFVRKFQPERYELWKAGKDIGSHPEDPARQYAAPAPKKLELALCAQRERKKLKDVQKIKRHPIAKPQDIAEAGCSQDDEYETNVADSDEDTKFYDVNEIVKSESSKKRLKNQAKVQQVKKQKKKPKEIILTASEISSQDFKTDEFEVKLNREQINEVEIDATKEILSSESEQEVTMDTSLEEENLKHTVVTKSEPEEEVKSFYPNETILNESVVAGEKPPELKPFWDREEKIKQEKLKQIQTTEAFNSQIKLFEDYPKLQEAVNAGSFSIVTLDSKDMVHDTVWSGKSNSLEEDTKLKTELSPVEYPLFTPTWRCERNGLKIKLKSCSSSPPDSSPLSQQSLKHTAMSSDSSVETVVLNESVSDDPFVVANEAEISLEEKNLNELSQSCSTSFSSPIEPNTGTKSKSKRISNLDTRWATHLTNLWQHEPRNFDAEIAFNERLASVAPHCAICVVFSPLYHNNSFPTEPVHVPSYSAVKMPAYCYGNSLNSDCMIDTNSLLRMDGTAPLLTCSRCKVSVHATCYGVSMLPLNSWVCTRCTAQAFKAECCLCVLRGGALKPTTDGRWVHAVCAILIAETFFENTIQKQPVNVSKVTSARQRLKCRYCFKTSITKEPKGACVQCRSGKCFISFHVTCGYMAGVIFETCDWPDPIHMICTKHTAARRKPPKRELTSISVGEKVIAKHRNKRYYWANVISKYIQEYYSILFDDNSHSTNTLPEDIVSRSITESGTPQMNEKVRVKWPDGEIYNGMFKGSQSCELYVIEFDDGSVMRLERKEIYAADEELPKAVQSKVSHSSERHAIDYDTEKNGKRVRITNSKYRLSV
ncbi:lysine-specific demethylase 4A [Parasteatoda tepidariorum]|nr:lysine-specific demethylase 4A [Parasteatoda tepidariorum]